MSFFEKNKRDYLEKAIEKQDYDIIEASIRKYKQEKHIIKKRQALGELIYKQLQEILLLNDKFNNEIVKKMEDPEVSVYDTYNLASRIQNIAFYNPKIAYKIKIVELLLQGLWLEFKKFIEDNYSNTLVLKTVKAAIIIKDNKLLVEILDKKMSIDIAKKDKENLKSFIGEFSSSVFLNNNFAALKYMLEKAKIDVNFLIDNKNTLLSIAVDFLNVDAVDYLLNEMDAQPNSLSYYSSEVGYVPPLYQVVLSYSHNFDPNMGSADLSHLPPFEKTSAGIIARYLLEVGANTNFEVQNVHFIFLAIQVNAVSIVKHAIETGQVNMDADYGVIGQPRGFASYLGRKEILDLISQDKRLTEEYKKINSDDDTNGALSLIENRANAFEAVKESQSKKKIHYKDEEEPDNNCIVCNMREEIINPEVNNIFAGMFKESGWDNSNYKQSLGFDIFENSTKALSLPVENKNALEKLSSNLAQNHWLNDAEINKLLLSIGPINHKKINQLIKEKGGQPIKAIKYMYNLPDGGKGVYIEDFGSEEKDNYSLSNELKVMLGLADFYFNPPEPIYLDEAINYNLYISNNNHHSSNLTYLVFDEGGFRISVEQELVENDNRSLA